MQAVKPKRAGPKKAPGRWLEQFRFDHVKVLIVGRGPVRLEALAAFDRLGAQPSGILLSEKDSVVYRRALAPELRRIGRNERVHRIPDYAAGDGDQRPERIARILEIARSGGYTHLFAGYGFMAEDHDFIDAVDEAGLGFVGPSAAVARRAGTKDSAKALARSLGVPVIPGVDNILALALLAQARKGEQVARLRSLVRKHRLEPEPGWEALAAPEAAERLLRAALARGVELVELKELQAETARQCARLFRVHPGTRLRLKHVGGGGGKGQRVISAPDQAAQAVFEVLAETRTLEPGGDKNFLIELNQEGTRHSEIQLLGNGDWCVALGGRDCSLQMHEQKLLEVSITAEALEREAEGFQERGLLVQARTLQKDLATLLEMESEAERFGVAVALDSASTFESIVTRTGHYFMEMNTRIQVEHRVTEMVYALRFTNPADPGEFIRCESLVEAMLWVAVHGRALPRPERISRHGSGTEVRINATDDALQPHGGGMVLEWTPPIEEEIRDDQGIGIRNPDTGIFMPYQLAGAYDSNAALVVSHGESRRENFERLAEILRRMEVRGEDIMINRAFHLGLLHWMLGTEPMVKPSTGFVRDYLAAVGALKVTGREVDLDGLWEALAARNPAVRGLLAEKITLILRPLRRLYRHPHLMAGWLAPRAPRRWEIEGEGVAWRQNPLRVLEQLYRYLRLERHPDASPEETIWDSDQALLERGLAFYDELRARLQRPELPWTDLAEMLAGATPPKGFNRALWNSVRAAHNGHQLGLSLLTLPIHTGREAGFYGLRVGADLEPIVPALFRDPIRSEEFRVALAPPPPTGDDRILAWTGGTFYARPGVGQPPFIREGERFEAGRILGLLEVMKMFNPIRAPFDGRIVRALVGDGGVIVQKGQPLFEVEPDVPVAAENADPWEARRRSKIPALLKRI